MISMQSMTLHFTTPEIFYSAHNISIVTLGKLYILCVAEFRVSSVMILHIILQLGADLFMRMHTQNTRTHKPIQMQGKLFIDTRQSKSDEIKITSTKVIIYLLLSGSTLMICLSHWIQMCDKHKYSVTVLPVKYFTLRCCPAA